MDRRFAGKHHEGNPAARSRRQRRHDLREAGPARHRGDADLASREVIAHGHSAGAVLVPGRERAHAIEFLHGGNPMHVAIAHQGEMGVDTLGGEGLCQRLIDRNILHRCHLFL